jgi:hypothetical protein
MTPPPLPDRSPVALLQTAAILHPPSLYLISIIFLIFWKAPIRRR